jgi:hypothetical protein
LKQITFKREHDYYERFLNKIEMNTFSDGSNEPNPGALEYAIEFLSWDINEITQEKKRNACEMNWAHILK